MLNILADKNIYKLSSFLPEGINVDYFDPNQSFPSLKDIDALLVRTVTKLNAETRPEIPNSIKMIGTGSSGSDHIDTDYFTAKGIHVIDTKGSNATAVSEYVITSLLLWSVERNKILQNFKVGIVGAGATGTAVSQQLTKFGIPFCSYDPPKANRDSYFKSSSLKEVMNCDILTFHVPLTKNGAYPTFNWLDNEILSSNRFELVINASRGGVINELDLLEAMHNNFVNDIVIDVWEGEPDFNPALMEMAFIATPHIAGYSEQAKLNASKILAEKLALFFNFSLADFKELYAPKTIEFADLKYSLKELLLKLHPIKEYDSELRNLALRPDKKTLFAKLRVDRPYRYEYPFLKIASNQHNKSKVLTKLGVYYY